MNTHTARALLDDALYQVLDNKVFRMLLIVVVCLVAPTFLIGIREEGIVFLYGWKVIPYSQFYSAFGVPMPEVRDIHLAFIDGFQSIVVEAFAGTIGLLFCIAATAFFVPRMLEKGAADTLFSKPVSRLALLMARYVSGVLFVAVLGCVLVFGMHLGLLVTSGYSDPSFLWSALTLVYTFSLIHAFSTCVATFTRNSIAAILASLVFFVFNGCVHSIWVAKEHGQAKTAAALENARDTETTETKKPDESTPAIFTFMKATLDTAHYILPKTNDASVITRKLRRAITGDEFVLWDPAGRLTVMKHPQGFALSTQGVTVDLATTPAVWVAGEADRSAEIRLSRRTRIIEKPVAKTDSDDAKTKASAPKAKRQSANAAARELEKALEDRTPPVQRLSRPRDSSNEFRIRSAIPTESVAWSETKDGVETLHRMHFFASDDWMYEIDATASAAWPSAERLDDRLREFTERLRLEQNVVGQLPPGVWYEKQIGWTATPKYNAFLSIAESILFAVVMLGLAWFRLMRIDF